MKSKYRLAIQNGGRALYAEIELECRRAEGSGGAVSFSDHCDPDWEDAVRFGLLYARFGLHGDGRVPAYSVRVLDLITQPIDSTPMAVAYATAMAFWQAIGRQPKGLPEIDASLEFIRFRAR